jgi:carboxylesterase
LTAPIRVGAEPIDRPGAGAGAALLLHGFGDTPQTLGYLAANLAEMGWAVRAPLLPGHGRNLEAFAATTSDDWLQAARAELAILSASHPYVAVVGLSMGGALATILASESPDVTTLVLISPYLGMPLVPGLVARFHRQVALVAPVIAGRGAKSIRDTSESARNLAYGMATPGLLAQLRLTVRRAWAALPRVTVPTLYIQSHHDNRISPALATRAFARLGTSVKRLEWMDDGSHILTVDFGRDKVMAAVARWIADYNHKHP